MTESTLSSMLQLASYTRLNTALLACHAGLVLLAYFALPVLIHWDGVIWAWALVPMGLTTNGYWATLHEAIHGQLQPQAEQNRRAGRLLAILWGSSFRILRFGHLMHHRFNRHALDHPDCFDPKTTSPSAARLRFFAEILGGLYLVELLTPLLYLLPRRRIIGMVERLYAGADDPMPQLRSLAIQTLASRKGIQEIRQDAILAWLLLLGAVIAWGPNWPALAAFVFGRGLLVSLMDNIYHFRTPLDDVEFAYNLSLPRPLQALFLNMNMHRVHHRHMHAPWWQLPSFFAIDRDAYDGTLIRGLVRQARGPAPADHPEVANRR